VRNRPKYPLKIYIYIYIYIYIEKTLTVWPWVFTDPFFIIFFGYNGQFYMLIVYANKQFELLKGAERL